MKKSPALLASASILSLLALSACSTAPSERTLTLRHGRVILTPVPATSAPEAATPAPTPAPTTVSSAPVSLPPPVPAIPPPPPPPPVPVPAPAPVVVAPPLPPAPAVPNFQALRTGATVRLSWTLPESADGYRAIEILRDSDPNPSGRGRVRAVRASVTQLEDTLPNSSADYWYWLKLTAPDGSVANFGPFEATPAP